jgi:hypothetical protein
MIISLKQLQVIKRMSTLSIGIDILLLRIYFIDKVLKLYYLKTIIDQWCKAHHYVNTFYFSYILM